jgi:hypothetical protein
VAIDGDTIVAGAPTDDVGANENQGSASIFFPAAPAPSAFSVSDAAVTEGDSGTRNITFTVRRAGDTAGGAAVEFRTHEASARAPSDYNGRSGRLHFAPGQRTRTVAVAVRGDTADEPDETFRLLLSNPSGATIADGSGTATIRDDDQGGHRHRPARAAQSSAARATTSSAAPPAVTSSARAQATTSSTASAETTSSAARAETTPCAAARATTA